jgi:hypothetical protein
LAIAEAKQEIAANQQRIDANKANLDELAQSTQKRFNEMGEVVTKDQYTVLFAHGRLQPLRRSEAGTCLWQRLG